MENLLEKLGLTEPQAKAKDRKLRRIYNITLDEYTAILAFQGWQCAVCGVEYRPNKLFCVDHEHLNGDQGPVRGILCFRCNRYKVGALRIEEIGKIHSYMTNPPAITVLGGQRIAVPEKKVKRIRRRVRKGSVSRNSSSNRVL